jgi:hypothetical protein
MYISWGINTIIQSTQHSLVWTQSLYWLEIYVNSQGFNNTFQNTQSLISIYAHPHFP